MHVQCNVESLTVLCYFAYGTVMCVYVGQPLVIAASRNHPLLNGVTELILWLISSLSAFYLVIIHMVTRLHSWVLQDLNPTLHDYLPSFPLVNKCWESLLQALTRKSVSGCLKQGQVRQIYLSNSIMWNLKTILSHNSIILPHFKYSDVIEICD